MKPPIGRGGFFIALCFVNLFMAKNGNIHPSRIFRTPDELLTVWEEYKGTLSEEAKRWPKIQYVGKDGQQMIDYPKLPLVLEGLYVYCHKNYGAVHQYFDNKEDYFNDFVVVCRAIREEIKHDQVTGGLLNVYNSSITQRLNSLVDKQQTEIKGGLNIPNLPDIGDRK